MRKNNNAVAGAAAGDNALRQLLRLRFGHQGFVQFQAAIAKLTGDLAEMGGELLKKG